MPSSAEPAYMEDVDGTKVSARTKSKGAPERQPAAVPMSRRDSGYSSKANTGSARSSSKTKNTDAPLRRSESTKENARGRSATTDKPSRSSRPPSGTEHVHRKSTPKTKGEHTSRPTPRANPASISRDPVEGLPYPMSDSKAVPIEAKPTAKIPTANTNVHRSSRPPVTRSKTTTRSMPQIPAAYPPPSFYPPYAAPMVGLPRRPAFSPHMGQIPMSRPIARPLDTRFDLGGLVPQPVRPMAPPIRSAAPTPQRRHSVLVDEPMHHARLAALEGSAINSGMYSSYDDPGVLYQRGTGYSPFQLGYTPPVLYPPQREPLPLRPASMYGGNYKENFAEKYMQGPAADAPVSQPLAPTINHYHIMESGARNNRTEDSSQPRADRSTRSTGSNSERAAGTYDLVFSATKAFDIRGVPIDPNGGEVTVRMQGASGGTQVSSKHPGDEMPRSASRAGRSHRHSVDYTKHQPRERATSRAPRPPRADYYDDPPASSRSRAVRYDDHGRFYDERFHDEDYERY